MYLISIKFNYRSKQCRLPRDQRDAAIFAIANELGLEFYESILEDEHICTHGFVFHGTELEEMVRKLGKKLKSLASLIVTSTLKELILN